MPDFIQTEVTLIMGSCFIHFKDFDLNLLPFPSSTRSAGSVDDVRSDGV